MLPNKDQYQFNPIPLNYLNYSVLSISAFFVDDIILENQREPNLSSFIAIFNSVFNYFIFDAFQYHSQTKIIW